jgi:N-acetylneuraminate synthase
MNDINIANRIIGDKHKPFLIAEMSGNHNQSLERAMAIVEAAAKAGAHAIKLQTYTPDTMTIKGALVINDANSLWNGKELYDLYKEAYTPWDWHQPIFERARELGLFAFSTPFDETAVDFLESLGVAAYKIASFENTDWPLLKKVASTKKPIIMSTGAASISDIDEAVRILRNNGCSDLVLLKCTSTYPSSPENTNLLTIPHMRELYKCHIGLSDHTMGVGVSIASVALGARVIEKHFTLSRAEGGVDAAFSMEPMEFKMLTEECERAFWGLGEIKYGVLEDEKKSLAYKRSVYVVEDMKAGEVFTEKNIRIIRPGFGLAPKYLEMLIGKRINKNTSKGTALTFELIG